MDDNGIVYEDFSDFPNYAREFHKYNKSPRNNKVQGLPVELYNLDGQFLGSFNSIAEASRETEIPKEIIKVCCYFNRKIGDKIFIFKGDSFEDKKREIEANKYRDGSIIKRNSIWIKEYSLNGTAITYWSTPLEAAKAYGLRAHDISRCLKGERLTVGGKVFLPSLEPISKRLNRIKKKKK